MFFTSNHFIIFILFFTVCSLNLSAQEKAYFIDGFHGGIWGHYPEKYTSYIIEELEEHPDWKINLEIEPETWDRVQKIDAEGYEKFKIIFSDQSSKGRIEYVNPSYGQSYLFNTSGESIIRQFHYGMKKLEEHFPNAVYSTYSSEEPCFTSALPQILKSFGFQYASLKNPNTCWGGYMRAHGGELINWTGPDGSQIITSPRYEIEKLKPGSTWETIGNRNSVEFIQAAFDYGIENPIGMCLQDAVWRWGPWLKDEYYKPSIYTTWRNYFENIANKNKQISTWKFNQEDVLVSLVWGSQILQQLAQRVRTAENNIVQAEKVAVINYLVENKPYPNENLDEAWRQLLLAQHHDCWIVPYNGKPGNNWADKVKRWTTHSNRVSDEVISTKTNSSKFIKVYNTSGYTRNDFVYVEVPEDFQERKIQLKDENNQIYSAEFIQKKDKQYLNFKAEVPAFGYRVFSIEEKKNQTKSSIKIDYNRNLIKVNTPLYQLTFDKSKGGSITSLIAKELEQKEFVNQDLKEKFSGLQANFYEEDGFQTTFSEESEFEVLAQSPEFLTLQIKTQINHIPVVKNVTVYRSNPRIDFNLKIDWKKNIGIGVDPDVEFKRKSVKKVFYDDRGKLLTVFPLNLEGQRVFKNAPFDAMESQLENTFYDSWDGIKNNMIVNWVDVTDKEEKYGFALFSDHTTTYTHGKDFPLGLTIQYSGAGLWGRNYTIEGPSEVNYSILPHKGNWQEAQIWKQNTNWDEPLRATFLNAKPSQTSESLLKLEKEGWQLTSVEKRGESLYLRIFNAEGNSEPGNINFNFNPGQVSLVELNGEEKNKLQVFSKNQQYQLELEMPQFGFRTIKLTNYSK